MRQESEAKPALAEAKPPVAEGKPSVVETKHPAAAVKPSVAEAKPPVVEAKPPVVETKPPVVEAKPPVAEAKPPVVEAKPPVVKAKPPVPKAKPPVIEAKPPVVEAQPPVPKAKLPVVEAKPPVVEAQPPVPEAKPPVTEAKPPVSESSPPVAAAKPPLVEAKALVEAKLPVVETSETFASNSSVKPSEDSDDKPVAKLPVAQATETFADKSFVKPAEDSDSNPAPKIPVVKLSEYFAGNSFIKPAEDSDGKPVAKLDEVHKFHKDAYKESTKESKKKQKPFFIAIVVVMLIGGIGGFLLNPKEALNQLKQLQASLKQAEIKTFGNSKISQSVRSGFGQLTHAVLSISGQAPPDSKEASHKTHEVGEDPALHDEEASHTTYEVSKPLVKDLTLNDEYVCQIRAIQHIEIRSLEKGYLQNVLVDEGETVHQGQLLFQIKPNVYEADVQKSEAEVELSQIELENNQALVDKDIISATEAAMSAAKLAKVKAELELAKTHLGFTEIRAPFDGLIGRFGDIRLGSLLEENQLMTTLSDNSRLWVYFNVPEAVYLDYMKNKRLSQKVQLELANKEIYPETGTIEVIQSDFSSTSGNIAFRAVFSNPHALLRYGQTGKILWPKQVSHAVIVPQKSTFEVLDKRFIFVVDKKGVIHEREIKVDREEPNVYVVASGITPDEMFLLERQNKIDKGDKIRFKLIDPKIAIENLKLYAE